MSVGEIRANSVGRVGQELLLPPRFAAGPSAGTLGGLLPGDSCQTRVSFLGVGSKCCQQVPGRLGGGIFDLGSRSPLWKPGENIDAPVFSSPLPLGAPLSFRRPPCPWAISSRPCLHQVPWFLPTSPQGTIVVAPALSSLLVWAVGDLETLCAEDCHPWTPAHFDPSRESYSRTPLLPFLDSNRWALAATRPVAGRAGPALQGFGCWGGQALRGAAIPAPLASEELSEDLLISARRDRCSCQDGDRCQPCSAWSLSPRAPQAAWGLALRPRRSGRGVACALRSPKASTTSGRVSSATQWPSAPRVPLPGRPAAVEGTPLSPFCAQSSWVVSSFH